MLPARPTATPSAALVPVAFSSGSGMNASDLAVLAVSDPADANAALPAVVVARHRFGFGVGHIDHVVLVDVDAARPAELRPLFDERAVLIEDLDPVVVAVADEQPALRIQRERVRLIELARAGSGLPHSLMNLPVLSNFRIRLLPAPWPSATKMSPFGAVTTSLGW